MAKSPKKKHIVEYSTYNENDYNYEKELSKEFAENFANTKVDLYCVNLVQSKVHKLYGEAKQKDKKFLAPIEIGISLTVGELKTEQMAKGGILNQGFESFKFGVFIDELKEKNTSIKSGDFVKYFDGEIDRFYEVTTLSNITSNNGPLGIKPTHIIVNAVLVKENVIIEY